MLPRRHEELPAQLEGEVFVQQPEQTQVTNKRGDVKTGSTFKKWPISDLGGDSGPQVGVQSRIPRYGHVVIFL